MIRYRTGIDAETGKVLRGRVHLNQSIAKIVGTIPSERVMRLEFGAHLDREIGRNMHKARILSLYGRIIAAIHKWEPEVRIRRMQLVKISRTGTFGMALAGTYFPEGRIGNFSVSEPYEINVPLITASVGTV